MVRDPADTWRIAAIFPEFMAFPQSTAAMALREKRRDILRALAEPPRGLWLEDGSIARRRTSTPRLFPTEAGNP
jgi:hypothetical protein